MINIVLPVATLVFFCVSLWTEISLLNWRVSRGM